MRGTMQTSTTNYYLLGRIGFFDEFTFVEFKHAEHLLAIRIGVRQSA